MRKLIYLIFLLVIFSGCKEKIVHDLNETEANKLMAQLYTVNIEPSKEQQADGRWSINVPHTQASWVMKYLNENRLIRDENHQNLGTSSILSGREEQRFKFERALSTEIEYTLANIEHVLQARVHLNLPARDPFLGKKINKEENGSASVLLIVNKNFSDKEMQIKELVAGASGLVADTVTVLINKVDSNEITTQSVLPINTSYKTYNFFQSASVQVISSALILLLGLFIFLRRKKKSKKNTFQKIAQNLQKNLEQGSD